MYFDTLVFDDDCVDNYQSGLSSPFLFADDTFPTTSSSLLSVEDSLISFDFGEGISSLSDFERNALLPTTSTGIAKRKSIIKRSKEQVYHCEKKQRKLYLASTVPRPLKTDIRRFYLHMFVNVMNGFDINLFRSFFKRYARKDLVYKKTMGSDATPDPWHTLELQGVDLIAGYHAAIMQISPDRVIRYSNPTITVRKDTRQCFIDCDWTTQQTRMYDISIFDLIDDLARKFGATKTINEYDSVQNTDQNIPMSNRFRAQTTSINTNKRHTVKKLVSVGGKKISGNVRYLHEYYDVMRDVVKPNAVVTDPVRLSAGPSSLSIKLLLVIDENKLIERFEMHTSGETSQFRMVKKGAVALNL